MIKISEKYKKRFWSRVNKTKGCWNWTRGHCRGYGVFNYMGERIVAHRFSFILKHGTFNKNLVIDHLCRNRGCVNPAHLEEVTNKENILRGVGYSAVNARKKFCKRGHPLRGENITGTIYRRCRKCNLMHKRRARKASTGRFLDE